MHIYISAPSRVSKIGSPCPFHPTLIDTAMVLDDCVEMLSIQPVTSNVFPFESTSLLQTQGQQAITWPTNHKWKMDFGFFTSQACCFDNQLVLTHDGVWWLSMNRVSCPFRVWPIGSIQPNKNHEIMKVINVTSESESCLVACHSVKKHILWPSLCARLARWHQRRSHPISPSPSRAPANLPWKSSYKSNMDKPWHTEACSSRSSHKTPPRTPRLVQSALSQVGRSELLKLRP